MKKESKKRIRSIFMCLVMVFWMMPITTVFAWTAPSLSGGDGAWNVQLSDLGVLTWEDMSSATYDIEVDETAMGGTVTKIEDINTIPLCNGSFPTQILWCRQLGLWRNIAKANCSRSVICSVCLDGEIVSSVFNF